jgi:hypothetical protein
MTSDFYLLTSDRTVANYVKVVLIVSLSKRFPIFLSNFAILKLSSIGYEKDSSG